MSEPSHQDGNGVLNMEELRAWESGLFHTEAAMIKLIQIADKDGDMQATAEELENAREESGGWARLRSPLRLPRLLKLSEFQHPRHPKTAQVQFDRFVDTNIINTRICLNLFVHIGIIGSSLLQGWMRPSTEQHRCRSLQTVMLSITSSSGRSTMNCRPDRCRAPRACALRITAEDL